jgi:hypothetical protein
MFKRQGDISAKLRISNIYDNNKIKITPHSGRDFTRGAGWLPYVQMQSLL